MNISDDMKLLEFSKRVDWTNGYRMVPKPDEDASVIVLRQHTTYKEHIYSLISRRKYSGDHSLGYPRFEQYYGNGYGKHKDYIILDYGQDSNDFLLISPMRMMILNREFKDYQRIRDDSMDDLRDEDKLIRKGIETGFDGVGEINKNLINQQIYKTLFAPMKS